MALEELQNGRYRRIRPVGSGGMGEVFLMEDTRVSRQVAIKVLRSEVAPYPDSDAAKDAARLFQREAKAIAALDHPNILPLYDFGEEIIDGTTITYMVMPFSSEGSLAGWLRQRTSTGPLSLLDVAYLIEQAAEALQYAHDHQVIHLDVKPSNFLLRSNKKNPERPILLLADFGIARNSATAASSSRTIRGTPTSMAPEQWSSQPVPATDQYALAVMAYELLTGRSPFTGSMEQLMFQHFTTQPTPPSAFNAQLPQAVDAVILRALAKKPEDRYPSIIAFAAALEQAVQEAPRNKAVATGQGGENDFRATLVITPKEAQIGTSSRVTLPGGKRITVAIPSGVQNGQIIRLRGLEELSNPEATLILSIAITEPPVTSPSSEVISGAPTLLSQPESTSLSDGSVSVAPTQLTPQPRLTPQINFRQQFDPTADHDRPTVASPTPSIHLPEQQSQPVPAQKGRTTSRTRTFSIIGLVVLLLFAGTGFYYGFQVYNNQQANKATPTHSQTATAQAGKQKSTPTVVVTATATVPPGLYIADTYNGSLLDQTMSQTTYITVSISQNKGSGSFKGTMTYKASQQIEPLQGVVDLQGNFSFTVQQASGQEPLYIFGTVQNQSDGRYLKGQYCNSSTNSCTATAIVGYFYVGPGF
jgi:serine/threonine protein kinase